MTTTPPIGDPRAQRPVSGPEILVLGTAEWSSPIATNQHYVVRELAREFDVTFVESLGLRRPKLDAKDVSRMARRLGNAARGQEAAASYRPIPDGVKVISPIIAPVHRAPTRVPNRMLLHRAVAEWRQSSRPKLLWTFTPVTYELEDVAAATLYHCVDILKEFPGIDGVAIDKGERNLAARARLAIATSHMVEAHLRGAGFPAVTTLSNVADVDVFTAAALAPARRRPAAVFAGNLTPHKIDFELLRTLARALQGRADLLLAGPVAAGGGGFDGQLAELQSLGARHLGVLDLPQLAQVIGGATVGLIPYAMNSYTAGVSPLKCYEYLAGGINVISTPIPEVVRAVRPPFIEVAESPEAFVNRVLSTITPASDAETRARIDYAQEFGWHGRGRLLRGIVHELMGRPAVNAGV